MHKKLRQRALDLGLQAIAIAEISDAPALAHDLERWLSDSRQGEMVWMSRDPERRADPRRVLAGAKTLISCALNYYTPHVQTDDPYHGRISRYAWGDDYHEVLLPKLKSLAAWIVAEYPGAECLAYVDTGPVMEKPWAARAGLGWQGKHTNLISTEHGSWFFIGEILTTVSVGDLCTATGPATGHAPHPSRRDHASQSSASPSVPTEINQSRSSDCWRGWGPRPVSPVDNLSVDSVQNSHCGSCARCIDACPTRAITAPYQLDPRRCISYLTIEHKGAIPLEMRPLMGNHIYGCDICQDVCPWNRFATPTPEAAFEPRRGNLNPELIPLLYMTDDDFRARFKNSPIKRIKRARFLRNVAVALGNSKDPAAIPALQHATQDPDPLIREHAEWAIEQVLAVAPKVR